MTAAALMAAAATLGMVALTAAAVLTLVEPAGDKPAQRPQLADVLAGGLLVGFVALVAVLYVGASL